MTTKFLELRTYMLDNDEVFDMMQEIPFKDEFNQTNEFFGKSKEEIKKVIIEKMNFAYSQKLTRNILPTENFIMFVDNKPVCIGGIRIKLNKYWHRHSGNVWYKTRPSERNKGYATIFVNLLCQRLEEFDLKEIFAQCNIKNIGSQKVLENNNFEKYDYITKWNDTIFYKKIIA